MSVYVLTTRYVYWLQIYNIKTDSVTCSGLVSILSADCKKRLVDWCLAALSAQQKLYHAIGD